MDFGAHLPLIDFDGEGYAVQRLLAYADAANGLGLSALSANDHMLFSRPWLDGLVALATVLPATGGMTLMTSLALPVIRGPIQTAKTLGAIDLLSGGRLIVGVGPGSSRADYEAVGLDFDSRWQRFDDAVRALRALWRAAPHRGRFYSADNITLEPLPTHIDGPPIWIGSWGSEAGLKRTARLGDGWLASAYNTTPDEFREGWRQLKTYLRSEAKDEETFPNALSTMWTFVTESKVEQQRAIHGLAKLLNRDEVELSAKLTVGSADHCAGILRTYSEAGVQRVLVWPITNPVKQLEIFKKRVQPLVNG